MECNFRWKIYRYRQSDKVHVYSVTLQSAPVVETTPKILLQNNVTVVLTPHYFEERFLQATITFVECTEKVQAWKLFSEKKLYLE